MDFTSMQIRHAAGKRFLIDGVLSNGIYHKPIVLNETGEAMFLLLKEGKTKEEAAAVLAAQYDVPADEILEDIISFVNRLAEKYEVWR